MHHFVLVLRFSGTGSIVVVTGFTLFGFFHDCLLGLSGLFVLRSFSFGGTRSIVALAGLTLGDFFPGVFLGLSGLFVLRSSSVSTSCLGVTTEMYSPYPP